MELLWPASHDKARTVLLLIDYQNDFIQGTLAVPGAADDVTRLVAWGRKYMDRITTIGLSMDTHNPLQIFHPAWWNDENENTPAPFTQITAKDIAEGKWSANFYPKESAEYVQALEAKGKKTLMIWPYHCLQGTIGAALATPVSDFVYEHSILRSTRPIIVQKGQEAITEMYGILRPEIGEIVMSTEMNDLLSELRVASNVIIAGEAKSHCVLDSIEQLLEYAQLHFGPGFGKRVSVLTDTMSTIPGFEDRTEAAFEELVKTYKINLTTTDSLFA